MRNCVTVGTEWHKIFSGVDYRARFKCGNWCRVMHLYETFRYIAVSITKIQSAGLAFAAPFRYGRRTVPAVSFIANRLLTSCSTLRITNRGCVFLRVFRLNWQQSNNRCNE